MTSSTVRHAAGVLALLFAAAVPASAGAAAGLQVHATGHAVPNGDGTSTYVVECTAVATVPAAYTAVSCSAGAAHSSLTMPGQAASTAGTGIGPTGPYTICASGTVYPISGPPQSSASCRSGVFVGALGGLDF